jgi:hypothetical protein
MGTEVPGLPTSWAAEPLKGSSRSTSPCRSYGPMPEERYGGLALKPLHPMVLGGGLADSELWQRLGLIDALRGKHRHSQPDALR